MRTLSTQLLGQIFAQESEIPFLTLITLNHPSFSSPIRLVNNTENIVSRGDTYHAFPCRITLPPDDGEKVRAARIEFDNVSLELIEAVRSVTDPIDVKIEMVLSTLPDDVQIAYEEFKIDSVTYDKSTISASLFMDDFLNTELTSERYGPSNFPGLF